MSRTGKIARLPNEVRSELNERLRDGETGPEVLDWLNGLPEVKKVLTKWFDKVPISPQNLSEWRQGGYVDWLETEELEDMITRVRTRAYDLECATPVSEGVAAVLSGELARMTVLLLREAPDTEARWERLGSLLKLVDKLRRGDQRAAWSQLKEKEWEFKLLLHAEKTEEKRNQREFNRKWVLPAMEQFEADQKRSRKLDEARRRRVEEEHEGPEASGDERAGEVEAGGEQ